ncbi:alcohol dehydrogenase-like 7 [Juglans regia]|uniref:Alcohol dehydrogenase-like 7 n=1 Tax=Juglans regia TaxID=51240 RepID=A0A6P9DT11_JUGRE|nr:alcohol dehydrogenase-like 7 [Juglans regia]XP_035538576.1 alcohol dehydrogenase-like 7 [Juglans regia]
MSRQIFQEENSWSRSYGVAEGARLCGATKIIGVDLNPDKFEVGKKFGVTEFVNAGDCGNKTVSQVIKEITGGGADYCFECVGLASLVQEAYASCRKISLVDLSTSLNKVHAVWCLSDH